MLKVERSSYVCTVATLGCVVFAMVAAFTPGLAAIAQLPKQVALELMIMLLLFVGAWRYITSEQHHSFHIIRKKGYCEVWMA